MKRWNRPQIQFFVPFDLFMYVYYATACAEKCALNTQKFCVRSYLLHAPLGRQSCRYQKQGSQQDRRILRAPLVSDSEQKPSLESEAPIRH